jgi:hypothetical protein
MSSSHVTYWPMSDHLKKQYVFYRFQFMFFYLSPWLTESRTWIKKLCYQWPPTHFILISGLYHTYHIFNVLQHLYCGLGLITYTILYCYTTTLCLCWEQISGWGCILIITSHSSRFWSLYMYEEDLLWLWLLWVSSGWGVSSINHM